MLCPPPTAYLFRRLGLLPLLPFFHGSHALDVFHLLGECRLWRRLSGPARPRVAEFLEIFQPLRVLHPINIVNRGLR